MAISNKTTKKLWAKSGGICSFPDCNQNLIANPSNDIVGATCHIVAQKSDGPRGDINFPNELLDEEENLILLCPTHHRIIDADTNNYTIEKLRKMKEDHETYISQLFKATKPLEFKFSQLYYINVPRISLLAAINGIKLNYQYVEKYKCLHELEYDLNNLMYEITNIVNDLELKAFSIDENQDFSKLRIGQLIQFNAKFRTKNVPYPEEVSDGTFVVKGTLEHDPYLYLNRKRCKLVLTIDPKWITTTTSFVNLSSGWVYINGIALVKEVSKDMVIATPYILGIPKSELEDILMGL